MVALGFMAAGESYRPGQERERKRERERERERERGRGMEARQRAIFSRNELYASRGFQYVIYRPAFHYFCVVRTKLHDFRRGPSLERSYDRNWPYRHCRIGSWSKVVGDKLLPLSLSLSLFSEDNLEEERCVRENGIICNFD